MHNTFSNATPEDLDPELMIQKMREIMASATEPQFKSVVVSPDTKREIERISQPDMNIDPRTPFSIESIRGTPIYTFDTPIERIAAAMLGEVPTPAFVEYTPGDFFLMDKLPTIVATKLQGPQE
jgi:hypothetical protein